nr:hypothetical protein [Phyllobacterium sp. 2063]
MSNLRALVGTEIAQLQNFGKIGGLNRIWTMSGRSSEQCFQDQRSICSNIFILFYKMKISLQHSVSLSGVIHQQKRSHVESNHDANEPDKKGYWECYEHEAANSGDQNCGFGSIFWKVDQNRLAESMEKGKYRRGVQYGQDRNANQQQDKNHTGCNVSIFCALSALRPKQPSLFKFQFFHYGCLEVFKRGYRIPDRLLKIIHSAFKGHQIARNVIVTIVDCVRKDANIPKLFRAFFEVPIHEFANDFLSHIPPTTAQPDLFLRKPKMIAAFGQIFFLSHNIPPISALPIHRPLEATIAMAQKGAGVNDNDIPAKPWEVAICIVLLRLLVVLIVLDYLYTVEVQ